MHQASDLLLGLAPSPCAAALKGSETLRTLISILTPNFPLHMPCAAALKGNETLRTLELSYNPVGADGAKAFADVIKYDMQVRGCGSVMFFYFLLVALEQCCPRCVGLPLSVRAQAASPASLDGVCSTMRPLQSAAAHGSVYDIVAVCRPLPLQVETVGMGWCKIGAGEGAKAVADMLM